MAEPVDQARRPSTSAPDAASDLWRLVVDYAKQETIDPLKGLGRYLGYGIAGAVLLGIGCVLLVLAGLRALQTETGSALTGNLSWIPYLVMIAASAVAIVLAVRKISGGSDT